MTRETPSYYLRSGATVIAEGIQTEEEAETLMGLGVRFGQGYHFGRPVDPDASPRPKVAVTTRSGREVFVMKLGCMLLVALVTAGASVEAQSLGDMAQKEKERREAKAKEASAKDAKPGAKPSQAKVYTGDDLAGYTDKEVPAASSDEVEGGQAALPALSENGDVPLVKRPAEGLGRGERDESEARARNEEMWRDRARAARAAIASAEDELAAAEKAKAALGLDTNPDVPRVTYSERARAAEDRISNAKARVAGARAGVTSLEEEARRAGVSPGWLR